MAGVTQPELGGWSGIYTIPARVNHPNQAQAKTGNCIWCSGRARATSMGLGYHGGMDFHSCSRASRRQLHDKDRASEIDTDYDVYLANNPRHTKIKRQYWTILKFGTAIEGCLRFCMPKDGGRQWSAKQFEEACKLDDDDWVGPPPKGSPKMGIRWRVKNCETGYQP